ncbi:MAG: uroporphyrinogen-III C-methyltransferase [Gammaproteobacteria bacterium]
MAFNMTQEETPKPADSADGHPEQSAKSKRKIVVSHTPLKGKHTEDAIQFGPQKAESPRPVFDEEALLHPAAAMHAATEPTFKPIEKPTLDEEPAPLPPSRQGLPLFFSFMALIAVIIFGYVGTPLYFQLKSLLPENGEGGIKNIQVSAKEQAATLKQLQAELASSKEMTTELKTAQATQLTQIQTELKTTQDRILQVAGRTDEGWILAEAQYLVRMARERLIALQDVETAMKQLNAADERVKRLNDPGLVAVREAIAKDVTALKSIQRPDREGLWLALNRMESQISALALVTPKLSQASDVIVAEDASSPLWKKALTRSWQEIKSLIRVRHHDGAIHLPILSEKEGAALKHAIQLQLSEARLALLQGNALLYQDSLKTLKNWLTLYYESGSERAAIEGELNQLSAATITFQVPDLEESLNAVNSALVRTDRALMPEAR